MTFNPEERAKALDRKIQVVLLPGDLAKIAVDLQQAFDDGVKEGVLRAQPQPGGAIKKIDNADGSRTWIAP